MAVVGFFQWEEPLVDPQLGTMYRAKEWMLFAPYTIYSGTGV
jgi:hypothetical protein